MKSMVMFSIALLVAIGSPSELKAQQCPEWTFETNSALLTGTAVSVFDVVGDGTFVGLDTSETVNTPGLLVQLDDSPYTLSSTTLPASINISLMQAINTLDNPATPYVYEGDGWYFLSSLNFEVTVLNGPYFEATVEGEALRVNASGTFYEDFTLTIKGWLPDSNGDEILSYCPMDDVDDCVNSCWSTFDGCEAGCPKGDNDCWWDCYNTAKACAHRCRHPEEN